MGDINVVEKLKAIKAAKTPTKARPQAYKLHADQSDPLKLMIYGHSGTGKTFFLIGPLLCGERLLVLSSDFGSNGLQTVKAELQKRGKLELLNNMMVVDLSNYEDILEFLENPIAFVPDLEKFDPTLLSWEGFSSFNVDILDEYILGFAPGAENAGELRYAGMTHTQQDWQGMKRGTVRAIRKFMAFTMPNGKRLHKILTCLESRPETNKITQETQKGALIHGTGKDLLGPAFDAIFETYKEQDKDTDSIQYLYRCEGASSKFLVKSRGFGLQPCEKAEPERIWTHLTNGGKL